MKISIIIPTHNRADSLKNTIESIVPLKDEAEWELIIVDNNSTDHTKQVVAAFLGIARYVFEEKVSFTRARRTGEEHASGDILLYLDDDVIVLSGSLKNIVAVFENFSDCGVIACKVMPQFTETPPDWTLACQRSFNGWSLFNPEVDPKLGCGFQETKAAVGPMMAVRRRAFQEAGGFPPDTVGVETNIDKGMFRKLYIGPGDYGLCERIRQEGYKIYYSPDVECYHVISPVRFTVSFWRSRMIGEGHHTVITQRAFYNLSRIGCFKKIAVAKLKYLRCRQRLVSRLSLLERFLSETGFNGMLYEELWVHYYKAYLEMGHVLCKYPALYKFLWEIGLNGVKDSDFAYVLRKLPNEYKNLTDPNKVYSSVPVTSVASYKNLFGRQP